MTFSFPGRAARARFAGFGALLSLAFLAAPGALAQSRNVSLLARVDAYPAYSALCAYVHSDGREYAVLGTQNGTAIYNIVNPAAPALVAFIAGSSSVWREMKQHGDHIYVVSEGTGAGLQIIRMTDPQNPVLAATYNATFTTAHTVTIDHDRALLYANGANSLSGGMRILSIASPEAPVEVGSWLDDYVHDCHVRGTRLYASLIFAGQEAVLDVSNPAAPVELNRWTTPGAFTHSSSTSTDGNYLFTTDENSTGFLTVYDISNPGSVTEVARWSANPNAIVHNIRVKGDTAFVSYYTEGVRLLDISDPETPAEFGYYDTWSGASGGFNGNWDVDPFFPSGVFIVSDMTNGLYVFRADPDYGTVEGTVTDNSSGLPVDGAAVTAQGSGQSVTVNDAGRYRFALDPGSYTFDITRFGYYPVSVSAVVGTGSSATRNGSLVLKPLGTLSGVITGGPGAMPLSGAEIHLHETPVATTTPSGGGYSLPVPEGTYLQEVERAGYLQASRTIQVTGGGTTSSSFNLTAMNLYDDVETNTGWTLGATGDNATSGQWIRADPVASGSVAEPAAITPGLMPEDGATADALLTSPLGFDGGPARHPEPGEGGTGAVAVQPEEDHTPAPGTICFVTGNAAPGAAVGTADVDGGKTTVMSPTLNMAALADPHVAFYYWYVNDGGSNPGEDPFEIGISRDGGATWTKVASIYLSNHRWQSFDFRVSDFVVPSATMKVRFVAQDLAGGSIVEAAVDDFGFYDAPATSGVPDGSGGGIPSLAGRLTASPNPFLTATDLRIEAPGRAPLSVNIYDASGRLVRRLYSGTVSGDWTTRWDGADDSGRAVPAGLYFVRAAGGAFERVARIVRVR